MSERSYDPDFQAILPLLPTEMDFSSAEKVQEIRENRTLFGEPPPDRDDVLKQDREIPGPDGTNTTNPAIIGITHNPNCPLHAATH